METDIKQPQQAEIDPDRQQKAREYARIRRQLSIVGIGIAAIAILFIFWSGLDVALRDWLQPLSWQPLRGWYPLQVLIYFLVLMLGYEVLTAPLAYYGGYVLPHRYGLSTMTLPAWLADLFKGLVLSLILESLAVEVIYVLLATQPQTWWLWTALILLFFTVIMANLAPVLILPIFYKFTPLPEGELTRRLLALAERAHTRVRGVFSMQMSRKTTAANAALMGLGNTRRIVLGDTMLDRYTPDEIEVVLAHELGHHVHHDLWKLIISQSILTLGGLYLVNLALHWAVDTQHYYLGLADPATMPFLLLVTATRLANQNLADIEPSPLIEFLFHDHPAISKRLKHADAFAGRYGLNASMNAESLAPTSSTDPEGMPTSGSSTPDAAH